MICGRCFKRIENDVPYATVRTDAVIQHQQSPFRFARWACYLCPNCIAETGILSWGTAQQRDKVEKERMEHL